MRTQRLARLKSVGLSLGMVLAVTGTVRSASADEGVTKGTTLAPNVPSKTRVVHIGLTDVTSIAATKGWFAQEFAKYNAKPDMVLVSAYGANGAIGMEAALLDRGDLQVAQRMAYLPAEMRRAPRNLCPVERPCLSGKSPLARVEEGSHAD